MFARKTYKAVRFLAFVVVMAGSYAGAPAQAQSVTETSGISFGSFALANNNAVHTLSFTWTESVTADPAYILFTNPQRGEYAISGFPALSPLSVTIQNATLTKDGLGGGEAFSITTYDRNAITTDGGDRPRFMSAPILKHRAAQACIVMEVIVIQLTLR